MSEIRICQNDISLYAQELVFDDGLPVVAGYCRVSSDDQADEGHSLSAQEKFIREACIRKFGEDAYHIVWVRDEGLSGRLPYRKDGLKTGKYRPGLTLVTDLTTRHLVSHLAVYKVNRLCRSPRIWFELFEDFLEPNDVEVFSAVEPVDNRTAAGKFITNVLVVNSGFERDQIVSVCHDGQKTRLAEGYPLGQPGYGWRFQDKRSLGHRQRVGIEPVPEQAEVVKHMVDWFLVGWNPPKIARELSSRGILSPRGRRTWSKNTVRSILADPHHAGLIRIPEALSSTGSADLARGAHCDMRIIEESTYWVICERLRINARVAKSLRASTNHLLGEVARCGVCGKTMNLSTRPGVPTRYVCPKRVGSVEHPTYGLRLEWVEDKVLDSIRSLASTPEFLAAAEAEIEQLVCEQDGNLDAQLSRLRGLIKRNTDEFVRVDREYRRQTSEQEGLTKAEYEAVRDDLRQERQTLEKQIVDVQELIEHRKAREEKLRLAHRALRDFQQVWDSLELVEKRAFVSYLIEDLTFVPNGTDVDVHLKLVFMDDQVFSLPCRGRGGRSSTGLRSLSNAELTTAHLLIQGHSINDIADIRHVHLDSVREYVRMLVKRTGAGSIDEALELVAPVVEERRADLMVNRRRGKHFEEIFTKRQIRILELTAQHLKAHEIGAILGINATTVGHHRWTIYQKLGVHSARAAVKVARERGLIGGANEWSDKPTPMQMQLLRELAAGGTHREVADRLGVTLDAVKSLVKRMSAKFKTADTHHLLSLAAERHWLRQGDA